MNIKQLIYSAIVIGLLVSGVSSTVFAEVKKEPVDIDIVESVYSLAQKLRYSKDPEERRMSEDFIASYEKMQQQKRAMEAAQRHQKIVEQSFREGENHEIVMRDQGGFKEYLMKKKGLNSVEAIRFMEQGDYFEVKRYGNMFAEAKRREWAKAKSKNSKKK